MDSGERRPRCKRTRARSRSPAPIRLSRSDLRLVKTLLHRHARKRSRSTRSATASSYRSNFSRSDFSRDRLSSAPGSSRASRSCTPSTVLSSADSSPSPRPCCGHRHCCRAQPRSDKRHSHRHHRSRRDRHMADGSCGRLEFYPLFPTGSRVGSGGVSLLSCMFYYRPTSLGLPWSTRGARMTKARSAQLP